MSHPILYIFRKAVGEVKSKPFEVNLNATIEGLRAFTLHGERYIQVFYSSVDEPDAIHSFQMIETALPESLRVQNKVRIKMILGVVSEIERQ